MKRIAVHEAVLAAALWACGPAPAMTAAPAPDKAFGGYAPPYAALQPFAPQGAPYGTVDFWESDRLEVPVYKGNGNMLFNPSFEEGFRYYTFPCDIGTYEKGFETKYAVDATESKFGGASLKIRTLCPVGSFDRIQSFGYPVKDGTAYVLSFYAKASKPGLQVRVGHVTENSYSKEKTPGVSPGTFALTDAWERYVVRIQSHSSGYAFTFQVVDNDPDGAVWIDGVQLEEGTAPTAFADRPAAAVLVTAAPGNFLAPGQKAEGRLIVKTAAPGQKGTVSVAVKDFFYNETDLGKFQFATDASGAAEVRLPLDDFAQGRTGVFVARAHIRTEGGADEVEYFRFSIMDKMEGKHRNKDIFSYHQLVIPNFEQGLQRWRDIGLGATNYFFYDFHNKLLFDLLPKYGIDDTCALIRQPWDKSVKDGTGNTISIEAYGAGDPNPRVLVQGMKEWEAMTPEREKAVQAAAKEYAQYYSWRKNFAFHQEISNRMLDEGRYDDLARLLVACAKGVKEASPDNQVYPEGGAAGIRMGTSFMDNLLASCEKVAPGFRFDRFAVHAYGHPENEELDDLLQGFLAVLDKHGYGNAPLYIDEGGYYAPFCIDEWRLTPYRPFLMDQYHLWAVSYDMGWGERASAALTARAWLLALKHQDRIKQFNMWRPFIYLDCDLAPMAVQKAANTLARLLGNASFRKEIVFAAHSKAYVFEDDDKTPIAAVWGYEDAVETGAKAPPTMEIPANGAVASVVDLMENARPVPAGQGALQLPLTPFPVFLKGNKGELGKLVDAVGNISIKDAGYPPIHVTPSLKDGGTLSLGIKNLLSRSFSGELQVAVGKAGSRSEHLEIPALAARPIEVKLGAPASSAQINQDPVAWSVTPSGGAKYSGSLVEETFGVRRVAKPISVTGNLAEWDGIPFLPIRNLKVAKAVEKGFGAGQGPVSALPASPDFQARFKAAWDDDYFYLLVDVVDAKLYYGAPVTNRAEVTNCDVMIAYFDTLCDGKDRSTLRVDSDDYYYAFLPRPDEGRALVYVQEAANPQLGLGVTAVKARTYLPEVRTSFRKTDKGYVYEAAFPKWTLLPLPLRAGSAFGFGLMVNDKDDEADPGRSLNLAYPPGASCWRRADLWPQAILQN